MTNKTTKASKTNVLMPLVIILSVLLVGVSFGAGAVWTKLHLGDKTKTPIQTDQIAEQQPPAVEPVATTDIEKSEKPNVELFVMSHCPYGTQIEKGVLPVVKALGNKIDFELKFVSYAMHGEKELTEQLQQYCIQKEEPSKLLTYLECFLEADDSAGCRTKTGIDQSKMSACVTAADKEYNVMEKFADKSTWLNGRYPLFDVHKVENEKYGVRGSPALVINGQQVSNVGRSPASLLVAICGVFETQPTECNTTLASDTPAPGFGSGTTDNNATADCGE